MTSDRLVHELIEAGAVRLEETIRTETPVLADPALRWLRSLTLTNRLADYFHHPLRFPMLRLPGWAVEREAPNHPVLFADTVYSTMAGYYHIRLLDDLVDRQAGAPLELLPLAALFHTEFQSAYLPHFPAGSPFWPVFRRRWLQFADATATRPAPGPDQEAALFARAGATVGAVVIPLRALTLGMGVPDRFDQWEPVVLELARIDQLMDDVLDWQPDLERNQPNLLLADSAGRTHPGESSAAWVVREGYRRGLDAVRTRLDLLRPQAATLGSAPLLEFLAGRRRAADTLEEETGAGLAQLASLAMWFDPPSA
jgi:hypothetical protein